MNSDILYRAFDGPVDEFELIPKEQRGKIYVDVPHRFFPDVDSLKEYVRKIREMGANVLLLLPHFFPSFSEYVVKNYERPCKLFDSWETFAAFMKFVESLEMDRMIDIPFNHADWQAENLQRSWFKNHANGGIEAGADDIDADGNRVRINWGAYVLDNGNKELIRYWLEKIVFPHISDYHVNSIRIDAAWGLDPNGLKSIIGETKVRFPHVWFVAENLGMARLIDLAKSGLAAGGERYFNNFYWYSGGRYIPSDIYMFWKRSGGKPTCSIYSSHDVLMPAMKALSWLRHDKLGNLNDKAIHRQIVEREKTVSIAQLSIEEREKVIRLMKLDFVLAAFLSTDLMWVAGSEKGLLERVDVLRSGPEHFNRGVNSEFPSFMTAMLRAKFSDRLFNTEGVIIPFGEWRRGKVGCRGYVKTANERILLVAANTDLKKKAACPIPRKLAESKKVFALTPLGTISGKGESLKSEVYLEPGQGLVLFSR